MRRRYIVTIITALVVVAYLTLNEEQDNKKIALATIQSEPDYLIKGLSLENFDDRGVLSQQIESNSATHYPHNNSVVFDQPKIILRQGSTPQWGITSNSGKLVEDKTLSLAGNIQVVPMQASAGLFSLSTQTLNIDLEKQIADTESSVIIESDNSKLTAIGMNMDMASQVTRFKSKVRGLHTPDAK